MCQGYSKLLKHISFPIIFFKAFYHAPCLTQLAAPPQEAVMLSITTDHFNNHHGDKSFSMSNF